MAACSIDTGGQERGRRRREAWTRWRSSTISAGATRTTRRGWASSARRRAPCYDFAVAYGTPFISGKDSMFNDFRGYDDGFREAMISIPPTLLVSSFGVVGDIRRCQTIDFKVPGDLVYLIGATAAETGGSEYLAYAGEKREGKRHIGEAVPRVDAAVFMKGYRALEAAMHRGLVASSMSVERGGLGLALAKSSMAGMLGFTARLAEVPGDGTRDDFTLFSESQGRVLVSVDPARADEFEKLCAGVPLGRIGRVAADEGIEITGTGGGTVVRTDVRRLLGAYKGLFKDF